MPVIGPEKNPVSLHRERWRAARDDKFAEAGGTLITQGLIDRMEHIWILVQGHVQEIKGF